MIININNDDINIINKLGNKYESDFSKKYLIKDYIDDKIHIIKGYLFENKIVGFILATRLYENIEIEFLYVDENYRNKKIATSLIENIQKGIGINRILLEVNVNNNKAINLYKKNGFKEINIRKGYYKGEDGLIMEKIIQKDIYILSVESSCDETSIAIIKNGKDVIALTVATQMDTHAMYGGVVPEIASRMHTESITLVLEETLKKANMKIEDVDAIAVAYKPGLLGALLVGVEFAKTLSFLYNKPLIGVNHLIGHIYANNIEDTLKFPLLALVVSGGHTELVIMKDDYDFEVLGATLDDAIGEVFDKVARVIGFKYPGGPNIEKAALLGKNNYKLSKPVNDETYNFSYSGLKSQVINLVNTKKMKNEEININDLACSFQTIAIDELCRKLSLSLENTEIKNVVVAGGVSANKYLREEIKKVCDSYNAKLYVPSMKYCTDNAAMIGAAAYPLYIKKEFKGLSLNPESECKISD